jgi:hypothetical protein
MRLILPALLVVSAVGAAHVADAQPEDRRRTISGPVDPNVVDDTRDRAPSTTWPGYNPRIPMPRGATSHTGVAPAVRDPSSSALSPGAAPADLPYRGAPLPPSPPR